MKPLPVAFAKVHAYNEKKMMEWVEPFRLVRQRTVCQKTTKDQVGTLPIALYINELWRRGSRRNLCRSSCTIL